ncbi:MAG: ROK family transcriptional regulator [Homoserinimonas sp.]
MMTSTLVPSHDSSPGGILNLVRSGGYSSRADIARVAGLAPSTVATRVDSLIRNGYLRETGNGSSNGGRPPRHLEVNPDTGCVLAVDLGARHATFALFDMAGGLIQERQLGMDIAQGPQRVLAWVAEVGRTLVSEAGRNGQGLRGIGIGLPGPVDSPGRRLVSPSRMPGWNGLDVGAELGELSGVPCLADNDANLMALGELELLGDDARHFVFVKAGSSIGCGVVASGALHRGHNGVAGDISHVTVSGGPQTPCSCGRSGCLDAVAGGAAIVASLRATGLDVADISAVLELAQNGHPLATQSLREAGSRTGGVLATIVNVFNPGRLVIGGHLSEADAFVAGLRSAIYTECLPMATDELELTVSRPGRRGGVIGAGRLILDHLFDASVVNETLV